MSWRQRTAGCLSVARGDTSAGETTFCALSLGALSNTDSTSSGSDCRKCSTTKLKGPTPSPSQCARLFLAHHYIRPDVLLYDWSPHWPHSLYSKLTVWCMHFLVSLKFQVLLRGLVLYFMPHTYITAAARTMWQNRLHGFHLIFEAKIDLSMGRVIISCWENTGHWPRPGIKLQGMFKPDGKGPHVFTHRTLRVIVY